MVKDCQNSKRGQYCGVVVGNRRVGEGFYRLGLRFEGVGGDAFAAAKAGQFIEVDLSGAALPAIEAIPENLAGSAHRNILLRRPFSFADIEVGNDEAIVEVLYCALGPASLRMTTLSEGDKVSVIGPLGSGFRMPVGKRWAVLVAGGMGAGPLMHLARAIRDEYPKIEMIALAGAKSAAGLPFEGELSGIDAEVGLHLPEFAKWGAASLIATDDGSAGYWGFVTERLSEWLDGCGEAAEEMVIYGCGPEVMLGKVAEIAGERGIECQVSMERMMACGIGLCQSCAVECKTGGETVYKMCCKDGPVFDGKEIAFG